MKKTTILALASILVIGLVACTTMHTGAMQFCTDGLAKLNSRNEHHYLSYTLEGSSNSSHTVRKGETKYWISGENWMSYNELYNYYSLTVRNERYHAVVDETGNMIWEPSNDSTDAPSPIPELDLSAYHVKADEVKNGVRTIILNYEESPKNGSQSTTIYQVEFQFMDNVIKEYRYSKQISFPSAEGDDRSIFYTNIMEFYELPNGKVSETIQSNYEAALSQNE